MQSIEAILLKGHQVASGANPDTPYPAGSITLQKPYFKKLGLDLSRCFDGTLNLRLPARSFDILKSDFCFEEVQWIQGFRRETFSFVACQLEFQTKCFPAWVYYPHPETKTQHFQQPNLIEILAQKIDNLAYGDTLTLHYDAAKLRINHR
ncbi:hypothetical protein GCM10009114_19490 [Aliiglaciecola litoralis]|uniref:SET domain-containing protein n=2 Tax=Aliiglaciecola litoralis TaxID=582857 RepID=A0ABP3WY62_9ALTE